MNRRWFEIEGIHVAGRIRDVNQAKVAELAKSISDIGLIHPPAVRLMNVTIDGEEWDNTPVLISGRHRLLALQSLGEVSVECDVYDVDDLQAELMEIDENLARADLTPAQQASHIARRKKIWEERRKRETGGISPSLPKEGRGNTQFASELASVIPCKGNEQTAKREINRKIRRAETLGSDIDRIVGTSLDRGVEMDALIKMPEPERRELIDRASAGEKVTAKPVAADKALDTMREDFAARDSAHWIRDTLGHDNLPALLSILDDVPVKKLREELRKLI